VKIKKSCLFACQEGTMGVWWYSSIHSAVDGGEWLALCFDRFITEEGVPVNI